MLVILVDAVVLMSLMKSINDQEVDLGTAVLVALGAAIGANILAAVLTPALGLIGIFAATIAVAGLLGFAISALFGTEIKRSVLIGGVFAVVHVAITVWLSGF